MFTTHFKMTAQPFCERTPVERLRRDERIKEGLARLEYLAQDGTIALVTGPTGVGKSSLIKLFVHSLSRNRYQPVYMDLTNLNATSFLKLIVSSLGEVPLRGKERLYLQILGKAKKTELTTLLIIDEAHLTDSDALTDLRLLVSSGLEDQTHLKILLSGQDSLRRQLKRDCHTDLVHRISVRYHLSPLSPEQTSSYIDFQMKKAGASEKIFEEEAKQFIHDFGCGIPRQINNIATACLMNAASKNQQKVTAALVNDTAVEFHLP